MTATRNDVRRWLDEALERGSAFLIVAVDQFDYQNYPLHCVDAAECTLKYLGVSASSMQVVDEVYDMSLDIEEQLAEKQAWHLPR